MHEGFLESLQHYTNMHKVYCADHAIQCMECGLGYGLSAKYISNKYCDYKLSTELCP